MRVYFGSLNNNIGLFSKPRKDNRHQTKQNTISINQNLALQKRKHISFEGQPWEVPYVPIWDGNSANYLYGFFKTGNYLDSSDSDIEPEFAETRRKNLAFLDSVLSAEDKKVFVDQYKQLTGFPDLPKVSRKIEQEFLKAIYKTLEKNPAIKCIAAGYDDTCSVGKGFAFPGSDLDKSFIVLYAPPGVMGPKDVDNFKKGIWENTDQRILSYNHDISFPTIYSLYQVTEAFSIIDDKAKQMPLNKRRLRKLMQEEYVNLEKAAEFNVQLAKYFPKRPVNYDYGLTKEQVKNFSYFIESVRDGKYLIKEHEFILFLNLIKDSPFYKYSNVAQMQAMRKAIAEGRESKTKIKLREKLQEEFDTWDIHKQYDFIKNLIKYSCEDQDKYMEYFKNDRNVKNAYKPLLNMLTQGDRTLYNRPEYEQIKDGIRMHYGENRYVDLYHALDDNALWVDSKCEEDLMQTIRMIDKIRQSKRFQKVTKIQTRDESAFWLDKFEPVQSKKMPNAEIIYERKI